MKQKNASPFPHSDGFKRYYTQDFYLRGAFGKKTCKIPLDAGFSCPNRDGAKGTGGCAFCSGKGSGEFAGDRAKPLSEQFWEGRERYEKKWPGALPIAYFQAFSNTYGSPERISRMLEEAGELPGVAGVALATRGDCVDQKTARLLGEFSRKLPLEVELGLQTIHPGTAARMNRCHTLEEFEEGYRLLKQEGIRVCVHLINGFPGETTGQMEESARYLAALSPDGVKLHMLHLIRGTRLAKEYAKEPFELLGLADYVSTVCNQLELLPADTVIQRLTGDGERSTLIAPLWTLKKLVVLNEIDKELIRRDSWQSKRYHVAKREENAV